MEGREGPGARPRSGRSLRLDPNPRNQPNEMNLHMNMSAFVALAAGILIFAQPKLLNFIVAIYLIVVGILGLLGKA